MEETPISFKAAQKTVDQVSPPRVFTDAEQKALVRRLRKEGREIEFFECRDEIRRKLRRQGADKDERVNQSWVMAEAEFPPLPAKEPEEPKEQEEPALTDEQIVRLEAASSEVDIRADILFAYQKRWLERLTIVSFEERPGAYQFWKLGKTNNAKFIELALKYLQQADEDDATKPDAREVELGDLHMAMEKQFPVEGEKVACPACRAKLQLPNSLRTGDDVKSPEFHLRIADPGLIQQIEAEAWRAPT